MGKKNGLGKIKFPWQDRSKQRPSFSGYFKDNFADGFGEMIFPNGEVYKGQ